VIERLRPTSIRVRLTLWYTALLAMGLLAYAGGVYGLLYRSLSVELDRQLHEDFERAEHAVRREGDGLRWLVSGGHHDEGPPETWTEYQAQDGGVLLRRPRAPVESPQAFRVYSGPYEIGGLPVTIRVGRSEARMDTELRRILLVLGLALPLVVVLAAAGGHFLARRALAPVGRMAERACTITAERLNERLPIVDPGDELGQLAGVMNELLARLEASFEQLRRFTADASHELRTPLTAIRSVGEVGLQDQRDPGAYREVIGSMLEEADRLTRMVDGLLTLSRADAGRIPINREEVDLSALATEVTEHLGVLAEEKDQQVEVQDGAQVTASVDPVVIRQALINLLDNAIKYGPAGSRIEVAVTRRDGAACLEVRDQGPGIPREHQPHVFDRFYRVDAARGGQSTGLGLSIAKWAVEVHAGKVELESTPAGSTFRIVIPEPVPTSDGRGG